MINTKLIMVCIFTLLVIPILVYADVNDYLILQDIGSYKFITQRKDPLTKKIIQIPGYTMRSAPGFLAGAGHFDLDHNDITYETDYESDITDMGVEAQVTQHPGSDSDKWLLHELDAEFRNYYGIPGKSYIVRKIDGHTTITFGSGGWDYRWLSGNKVIRVEYTDLEMKKPEPLEVVKAYLAKHLSTLPPITATIQRSAEGITIWIKDEMERRLWLSDKWFLQMQMGKVELDEALQVIVKSMNVFLDYREKYYNISAKGDKELFSKYLEANDGTAIKNKLTEYKTWWSVNKTKSINLP